MTEWITPKTDWKTGDYFNIEDAEIIYNNLEVLQYLAFQVYPNTSYMYFLLREDSRNHEGQIRNYYRRLPIDIGGLNPRIPSDDVFSFLEYNSVILWKFDLMRWVYNQGQTGVEYPIPYFEGNEDLNIYIYEDPTKYGKKFRGWAYYVNGYTEEEAIVSIAPFGIGREPFALFHKSVWDRNYATYVREFGVEINNKLTNTKFYNKNELNQIGYNMIDVYNFLIGLQNSYPPVA